MVLPTVGRCLVQGDGEGAVVPDDELVLGEHRGGVAGQSREHAEAGVGGQVGQVCEPAGDHIRRRTVDTHEAIDGVRVVVQDPGGADVLAVPGVRRRDLHDDGGLVGVQQLLLERRGHRVGVDRGVEPVQVLLIRTADPVELPFSGPGEPGTQHQFHECDRQRVGDAVGQLLGAQLIRRAQRADRGHRRRTGRRSVGDRCQSGCHIVADLAAGGAECGQRGRVPVGHPRAVRGPGIGGRRHRRLLQLRVGCGRGADGRRRVLFGLGTSGRSLRAHGE